MLTIVRFILKNGLSAAKKKFGTEEVKKATKGLVTGKASKAPKKPSPKRTNNNPLTGKPRREKKESLESMFGRRRRGPTPKPSDSKAFRDSAKKSRKEADEKLDPSLENNRMTSRSLDNRTSDAARQLREARELGKPAKEIKRLEARFKNLKEIARDRPDLVITRGRGFSQGGLTAKHTDYRKSGLFK